MTNKGDNRVSDRVVWQRGRQFSAETTQASDVAPAPLLVLHCRAQRIASLQLGATQIDLRNH
jgi:hypothetical protein